MNLFYLKDMFIYRRRTLFDNIHVVDWGALQGAGDQDGASHHYEAMDYPAWTWPASSEQQQHSADVGVRARESSDIDRITNAVYIICNHFCPPFGNYINSHVAVNF